MPCMTKELMYILNKMARLEKRLKRLDPDCKDVFDAPVRAVVERCLSAIDYYFLWLPHNIINWMNWGMIISLE